ncbi:hypothetical protein SAMN06296036_12497 [Pseudobacteriovorax antillogorgiicola]|uniref:Uncharacterized protein n=1 Tax=Pseudobacteriovorax antillogorgiicola TaxID=1513793 RepID=A0A1Y6CJ25_9BACT|nr:hypothetical protein EDD56_12497 [Pseudobacteriovorax antillogorgiicola]SMF69066.1 hypothetical protein SAMN06296036_12497 [Pseudobacteriovorax antillogorgiicola]
MRCWLVSDVFISKEKIAHNEHYVLKISVKCIHSE